VTVLVEPIKPEHLSPDGYIIEVGQKTNPQGDWRPADWPPINPGGQSG
jgi:hypothetical protein